MTDSKDRRQVQRRTQDRPPAGGTGLPVPVAKAEDKAEKSAGQGEYSAQLLGQGGEKRGLRGGEPVLKAAKSAYLGAEFSGPDDRRPPKGRLGQKAV